MAVNYIMKRNSIFRVILGVEENLLGVFFLTFSDKGFYLCLLDEVVFLLFFFLLTWEGG